MSSAFAWLRLPRGDLLGIRFAVNVFIGTTAIWILLERIGDTNPIWGIASMIASSDPQFKEAVSVFKSRLINVLVGCVVGLLFLLVGGSSEWKLPLALSVTVLVSSYMVHEHTMWRQAPITAAIVVAGGLTHHSKLIGVQYGLHKVAEVVIGCLAGLLVSFLMSRIWPLPGARKTPGPPPSEVA